MAYTALYRKLRPQTFDQVIGQEVIVKTLKNQLRSDRLSHAYLFTGTRGTGKTSTAKILARAANCLELKEGNPCNQCKNCLADLEANDMNIMEIDAASNNGVDNIRDLREDVRYQPSNARYKIYIIDEVHMLSIGAFNALLKTLEEPPAHVIFILATTDPHKIPDTILSRCQRYDFRRISGGAIQEVLKNYLQAQGVAYEDRAIRFIAKIADGALRDAHSILDRCLAFYLGEELTLERVLQLLGAVDHGVYEEITVNLLKRDISALLHQTDDMIMQGRDLQQVLLGELGFLRDILIVKTMDQAEDLLDINQESLLAFRAIAQLTDEAFLIYLIKELAHLEGEMKYESNKRILLELAWIKLCQPEMDKRPDNILRRLDDLERQMAQGGVRRLETLAPDQGPKPAFQDKKPVEIEALPEDIKRVIANWKKIDFQLNYFLKICLENAIPFYLQEGNVLALAVENDAGLEYLKLADNQLRVADFLSRHFKRQFKLEFLSVQEFESRHKHSIDQVKAALEGLRQRIDFDIEIK